MKNREIVKLCERVRLLELENARLKEERDFFRRTPTLAQVLKGETLIAKLTHGVQTGYKDPHDVTVPTGARLEVKYSHLNEQKKTKTKRWNWNSVFGERKQQTVRVPCVGRGERCAVRRSVSGRLAGCILLGTSVRSGPH